MQVVVQWRWHWMGHVVLLLQDRLLILAFVPIVAVLVLLWHVEEGGEAAEGEVVRTRHGDHMAGVGCAAVCTGPIAAVAMVLSTCLMVCRAQYGLFYSMFLQQTTKTINIISTHQYWPSTTMASLHHHQGVYSVASTARSLASHVVAHPTPICKLVAPRCAFFGAPNALHRSVQTASKRLGGAARVLITKASLSVTDDATGIQFPLVQEFWYVCCVCGCLSMHNAAVETVGTHIITPWRSTNNHLFSQHNNTHISSHLSLQITMSP